MKTTGNLNLKKPEDTDLVNIDDLNGNMDILDMEVVKQASATEPGRMSAADKVKLNGIAAGANKYTHPNHTGDVTSTGDGVTAIAPGVIVNADVNAAAAIDASKIGTGVVSNTEFGYLDGVTSGIQGQLNGKAAVATTPQKTTAALTYYVRTDGNDANNGLANTAGGAFKTVGKAISMIPQIVNHIVAINVASGTYAEDVTLSGIYGSGYVGISGSSATVKSISLIRCSRVTVVGMTANSTTQSGFAAYDGGFVTFLSCVCVAPATTAIGFDIQGQKGVVETCTISNRGIGIYGVSADIMINNNTGGSNATGVVAGLGSLITKYGTQPTGATHEATYSSIITSGVLNPWGDNNTQSRTGAFAVKSAVQSIAANTWTRVTFQVKNYDYMNEYDAIQSHFTVRQSGVYLLTARLYVNDAVVGGNLVMRVKQSTVYYTLDTTAITHTGHYYCQASFPISADTGNVISVELFSTSTVTINPAADATGVHLFRIS
ncbi:hypothetical protein GCM10010912_59220 [Paenibacillus albidus]|uniref:C1q domain-containing protein n=1 Tax=Paenibacillus albidus TaxID=2041023 RepID=A0A917D448_9BACL|nr:hypothetical protein [Paenibacillus albidus]GGG06715.1 hypothetical protein GCM10010912_59220 [Paenibacillus albidus]